MFFFFFLGWGGGGGGGWGVSVSNVRIFYKAYLLINDKNSYTTLYFRMDDDLINLANIPNSSA